MAAAEAADAMVMAAVDAGASAARRIGETVSVNVILRPHEDLASCLVLIVGADASSSV